MPHSIRDDRQFVLDRLNENAYSFLRSLGTTQRVTRIGDNLYESSAPPFGTSTFPIKIVGYELSLARLEFSDQVRQPIVLTAVTRLIQHRAIPDAPIIAEIKTWRTSLWSSVSIEALVRVLDNMCKIEPEILPDNDYMKIKQATSKTLGVFLCKADAMKQQGFLITNYAHATYSAFDVV